MPARTPSWASGPLVPIPVNQLPGASRRISQMRKAVLADPFDTAARLALADALEEDGCDPDHEPKLIRQEVPIGKRSTKVSREYRALLAEMRYPVDLSYRVYLTSATGGDFADKAATVEGSILNPTVYHIPAREIVAEVECGFVIGLVIHWKPFVRQAREWFMFNPVHHVIPTEWQIPDDYFRNPRFDISAKETEGGPLLWSWRYNPKYPNGRHLASLPKELWDRLDGWYAQQLLIDMPGVLHRCYMSKPDARMALSRACVSYGREKAELPPLEWKA